MKPAMMAIARGVESAHAELEIVLQRLADLPEPGLSLVETTCHALRNYLYVTRGTTQLLQEALREHPAPEVQAWVEGLLRATELMFNTVARLEPTAVPSDPRIKWEAVDVGRMAQRFTEHYAKAAEEKALKLDCQVTTATPGLTDRVMLASILQSLFSNAVKYSPPGTTITVTVQESEGRVVCSVRDQGPGLTAEEQAHLFEPGVRHSPQPTGNGVARGYGLAVAKQLADRLGVEISCVSEPGHGCCFSVLVPTEGAPT